MRIVALLDTFYGWRGYHTAGAEAPRYFRINHENFTGRRLYRICGSHQLLVTDSCRYVVFSAREHGTPEPQWVAENLARLLIVGRMDLLLVCGAVAKETYQRCGFEFSKVLFIDHPAARRWTNAKLDETRALIEGLA